MKEGNAININITAGVIVHINSMTVPWFKYLWDIKKKIYSIILKLNYLFFFTRMSLYTRYILLFIKITLGFTLKHPHPYYIRYLARDKKHGSIFFLDSFQPLSCGYALPLHLLNESQSSLIVILSRNPNNLSIWFLV